MKNLFYFLFALVLGSAGIVLAQKKAVNVPAKFKCNDKEIAKKCKPNMKPYKMDAYAPTELTFGKKPTKVEVQFTVFEGSDYKLVFCSSGFPEKVNLNIYDKSRAVKSRKKVYDGEAQGIDSDFWTFQPEKTGTYYIEYECAAASDSVMKKACVVMLIGYK
jgi:hypothetical protein